MQGITNYDGYTAVITMADETTNPQVIKIIRLTHTDDTNPGICEGHFVPNDPTSQPNQAEPFYDTYSAEDNVYLPFCQACIANWENPAGWAEDVTIEMHPPKGA